jgi:hypothetical protein
MALLTKLGSGQGYLKAGFLGFQKSGKTYTAMLLALGTRALLKLKGPLGMFDTEGGSEYIGARVKAETGQEIVGIKSRSFDDLLQVGKECIQAGVSILIVDSVTHVWRELCDAYLKQVNEAKRRAYEAKGWRFAPKTALEFQDWNQIKGRWSAWTDFYLNAPIHIVICGRAGYEYDMSTNEDTGKKELVKTGIKMKTEAEFGFEPSLLVEMERVQSPNGEGGFRLGRQATVLGDRFGLVDGKTAVDPTFEFFKPHVAALTAGAHVPIDTRTKSDLGVSEEGDTEWAREKKARVILCEEIQGLLVSAIPGMGAEDKKRKADLMQQVFGSRSWTAIEGMDSEKLRKGLDRLRGCEKPAAVQPEEAELAKAGLAPAAAPTTAPAPAVQTSNQPPATVSANGARLADELVVKLEEIIGQQGPAALRWMCGNGWLQKGQGFDCLSAERAAKIIDRPAQFMRAVAVTAAA